MQLFAVTAIEKVKSLPPGDWMKVGIVIASFILAILIFRRVMKMNKIIAAVIVFVVSTVVFFSWVYNRNEPKFLTPIVERIAPFFPSAGAYAAKQQSTPKQ
jgi:glucan phosphoethanolaminetransferase (alkaline phosphatase superfamily)